PINCIFAAYMTSFIAVGTPNTLLAVGCSYNKFGFGVCINAYSFPSSTVDGHFLSSYAPKPVEQSHPTLHGATRLG
ncbi:MAG: hypothetical protein M3436_20700, partial [Pseudomonadota bacterium]|nr:hypothetical protein [Pseudomonadota bacterium]